MVELLLPGLELVLAHSCHSFWYFLFWTDLNCPNKMHSDLWVTPTKCDAKGTSVLASAEGKSPAWRCGLSRTCPLCFLPVEKSQAGPGSEGWDCCGWCLWWGTRSTLFAEFTAPTFSFLGVLAWQITRAQLLVLQKSVCLLPH